MHKQRVISPHHDLHTDLKDDEDEEKEGKRRKKKKKKIYRNASTPGPAGQSRADAQCIMHTCLHSISSVMWCEDRGKPANVDMF